MRTICCLAFLVAGCGNTYSNYNAANALVTLGAALIEVGAQAAIAEQAQENVCDPCCEKEKEKK